MTTGAAPTVHEKLVLNEVLRTEAADVQKIQAMLPMIGDQELRQLLEGCVATGQAHVRTLMDFCQKYNVVTKEGH